MFGSICYRHLALVTVVVCGLGAGSAPTLADAGSGPGAWPQYRLNATNNAVFDNGGPALSARHFHLNGQVRANPVIVGDRLFIGAHDSGGLYAFNVKTGKPVRADDGRAIKPRKIGGSLSNAKNVALAPGGPVIVNQNLFIGSQDGFVYLLPLKTLLRPRTATGS